MITPEDFNKLILERRSIYPDDYSGERIDDRIIHQLLENANWAPTHKLTEPWRFVVYTGEGLKKLGELQANLYKKKATAEGNFDDGTYRKLLTKPLGASHVIVVGMKRDPHGYLPEIEEYGATFCAIENMYLTATVMGVGCYLGTGGITYYEEAPALFGFDRLIGLFYLGVPRDGFVVKGRRHPVEEKTTWVRGA